MDVWQIVLYACAAGLALKALVTLMTARRRELLNEHYQRAEEQRRADEQAAKAAQLESAKAAKGRRRTGPTG